MDGPRDCYPEWSKSEWEKMSDNIAYMWNLEKWCRWSVLVSHVWLFVTPWTVAHQAPLSMEFSSQEYWSGLPFPSPGDLPVPGIKPRSPTFQADSLPTKPAGEIYADELICKAERHRCGEQPYRYQGEKWGVEWIGRLGLTTLLCIK